LDCSVIAEEEEKEEEEGDLENPYDNV